ncbi:MAG: response regulator transcription factor [Bacteroidetes bacterium]|nr:response regulator transcription factor [Bacteroidota bacterium]MBU1718716.1 response regulator transcription factor [Bacteroidota bacterium]
MKDKSENRKIDIYVVDDHEIFRDGLVLVLSGIPGFSVIGHCSSGRDFLNVLDGIKPDIVLMDIEMPVMNGIDAVQMAISRYPDLKILALSMFGEEEYLHEMINAGAQGFVLKNISKEDLERAIYAVVEGKNYYSEELLAFFTRKFLKSTQVEDANLTKRELEVLQYIALGFTDNEIADKLFVSQRTVNGHRASLISKTGSKNTVNLLVYAIKNKLVEI